MFFITGLVDLLEVIDDEIPDIIADEDPDIDDNRCDPDDIADDDPDATTDESPDAIADEDPDTDDDRCDFIKLVDFITGGGGLEASLETKFDNNI